MGVFSGENFDWLSNYWKMVLALTLAWWANYARMLDDPRFLRGQRTYVNGQRVAFHAIRSATDPDWPANGPKRNPVIV